MVPSAADIRKRKLNRDKLAKKVTEVGGIKESELVRLYRKAVDSAWMTAAHKLVFLEDRVIPDMNPATRTKWLIKCNICEKLYKLDEVNVDHRIGEFACTERSEFMSYFESRLDVNADDLQILCIDIPKKGHIGCHSIKTLQERLGITFDEARLEKKVISVCKGKASDVNSWLLERGISGLKNADSRRAAVRQLIKSDEGELNV